MRTDQFAFEVTYNTKARKEKYTLKLRADNIKDAWNKIRREIHVLKCYNISMKEIGRDSGQTQQPEPEKKGA